MAEQLVEGVIQLLELNWISALEEGDWLEKIISLLLDSCTVYPGIFYKQGYH